MIVVSGRARRKPWVMLLVVVFTARVAVAEDDRSQARDLDAGTADSKTASAAIVSAPPPPPPPKESAPPQSIARHPWLWITVIAGAASIASGIAVGVILGSSPRYPAIDFGHVDAR
jgi:hypothetical protein